MEVFDYSNNGKLLQTFTTLISEEWYKTKNISPLLINIALEEESIQKVKSSEVGIS